MAKRIIRRTLKPIIVRSSAQRAEDILKLIRARQHGETKYTGPDGRPCVPAGRPRIFKERPVEPQPASPSADDWQKFKRDFVEEYAGERVQATGMTHSDFFDYFKNGVRECESPKISRLKELLEQLEKKNQ
jgi:hypothetical protein